MSQPNTTSFFFNDPSTTERSFSKETYLPRPTPSMSKPISLTLLICRSSNSLRSPSTVIRLRLPVHCRSPGRHLSPTVRHGCRHRLLPLGDRQRPRKKRE